MLKRIFLIILLIISVISSFIYMYTIKVYDRKYSIFSQYINLCSFNGKIKRVSLKKQIIIGEILTPKYIHNSKVISSDGKIIENLFTNFDMVTLIPLKIENNYFIIEAVSNLIDSLYKKYSFQYLKVDINYAQTELYVIYNKRSLIICFDNLKLDPKILIYRQKYYDVLNLYNYIDCRFDKYMMIK